jgi:hypothetical protein
MAMVEKIVTDEYVCVSISQNGFRLNGDYNDWFRVAVVPVRRDSIGPGASEHEHIVTGDRAETLNFNVVGNTGRFQVGRRYKLHFEEV